MSWSNSKSKEVEPKKEAVCHSDRILQRSNRMTLMRIKIYAWASTRRQVQYTRSTKYCRQTSMLLARMYSNT